MQVRVGAASVALIAAVLGMTSIAQADLISMDPNPVSFTDGNGTQGLITLVAVETGVPDGGIVIGANQPGANDVSFVFQVTMLQGTIVVFGVGMTDGFGGPVIPTTGGGWIPDDPGFVDITGMFGSATQTVFRFDADGDGEGNNNGRLDAGETTDLLFVSFGDVEFDGSQFVSFMITGSTTINLSVPLVVPAPATVFALGLGMTLLGGRRTRRRTC